MDLDRIATAGTMSIFKQGLLLIAAPVLFQGLFLAVLAVSESQSDEAERWALHTKEVINRAEEVLHTLAEESNQARGFILTANPRFTSQMMPSGPSGRVAADSQELARLVADRPDQEARARRFADSAARLEAWTAGLVRLVQAGRAPEAAERVRGLEGEVLAERARTDMAALLATELRLDRERTAQVARTRRRRDVLVVLAAVSTVLIAIYLVRQFSRNFSSRLAVVSDNATRLAENQPLTAVVGGTDELANLDRTMHAAARRLDEAVEVERIQTKEIERRAAELAESNEHLRLQTQEVETFVYSVSHDLRSPLVNLQGFGRELERSCGDLRTVLAPVELPAKVRRGLDEIDAAMVESVRFIQSAVSRSANIIDALLRLSRAGRVDYHPRAVDARATAARVVDAMHSTIVQKRVQVVLGELPAVWADPTALEQILGNLVGNAVSYLDPARPGRIEIGAEPGEERSICWVRDNGLGIPAGHRGKLFVAFQRLHGDVAPGEGIGLALVRRVVERLGGEIWCESEEGVGSTFYFSLPSAAAGMRAAAARQADAEPLPALREAAG